MQEPHRTLVACWTGMENADVRMLQCVHLPLVIFWPFLAWTVMLDEDIPWHVTVCSNSSQTVSLLWLEGKQESFNEQEQTVLSAIISILCPYRLRKLPGEKLNAKSWDLQISGFPSPLQILGFLTGWLWTGAQAKTHWAIGTKHTNPLLGDCLAAWTQRCQAWGKLLIDASCSLTLHCMRGCREMNTHRRSQGKELELTPAMNNQLFCSPWPVGCNETEKKSNL